MNSKNIWPGLAFEKCSDTFETLHMKMQVIGKIKLALNPFLNHWWNVALYISARGITSGPIPYKNFVFEIELDFISHIVSIRTSENKSAKIQLAPGSVAEFYRQLTAALESMDIRVTINKMPSEVPDPVPCDVDMRSSYEKDHVFNWWSILVQVNMVFEQFCSDFRGKASPIHFFWGSFDLCGTRFSGRLCAPPEHSGRIMRFAENEENFTFGFWPGNKNYPRPAFYSYMFPTPKGIESAKPLPASALFSKQMGEFILNYDDVLKSGSPEDTIMQFLQSTYAQSAKLAGWDIESLKQDLPEFIG